MYGIDQRTNTALLAASAASTYPGDVVYLVYVSACSVLLLLHIQRVPGQFSIVLTAVFHAIRLSISSLSGMQGGGGDALQCVYSEARS